MLYRPLMARYFRRLSVVLVVVFAFASVICLPAIAQNNNNTDLISTRAVGGVSINTDGILGNARPDALGALSKMRVQAMQQLPDDLRQAATMRKVSLKGLEAAISESLKNKKPIPEAVRYLAGLQSIQYVFVYPEQHDIVLVGPGEGWRVDAHGTVVGAETGRPIMLLDDLLVALRTAQAARQGGITCSIDPTPEGLARMNQQLPALRQTGKVKLVSQGIEKALGMQRISIEGVPDTTHFARVLVAADYHMKRIAMGFDPSPVRGLSSYLKMVTPGANGVLSPRFWLEPSFEGLTYDADRLAYELRGASVKAMTEEDYISSTGNVQHSGTATPSAQKWVNLMTEKYPQLAVADPIFGQLRNCMEMAVVAALIVKDRLPERAGNSLPVLMESPELTPDLYLAPKQVDSRASVIKQGKGWIISVSGGVAINSWVIVEKAKQSGEAMAPTRAKAAPANKAGWWWN